MPTEQNKRDASDQTDAHRAILDLVRLGTVGESDHDRAIGEILQRLKTYFDLPRVAVCLIDSGLYSVKCLIDDTDVYHVGDVLPLAGSWCEQVVAQSQSVLAVCRQEGDFSTYPGLLTGNALTYAGAPIRVGGQFLGTLNVTASEARSVAFDAGDGEVLDVAAALVGHHLSLQRAEQRFELAMRGSSVGFWEWDVRTDAIFWSPRYLEILDLDGKDVDRTIQGFQARQHPDDRARIAEAIQAHLERREPYDIEYRLRRQDGDYIWVHARGQADWDSFGVPQRMAGSVDDITSRKLADSALLKSEERYELAVKGTGVGIWDWDVASGEVFWSDQLLSMLGDGDSQPRQSIESFGERIHEEDRPAVMALLQSHLDGKADYRIEYRTRLPNGQTIWVHTRGQAAWDAAGQPVRMAGSCHDITARKTAELQIQQQGEELQRTNRELEQFAAIASHDLQEPLRKISSFGALLTRDYSDRLDDRGRVLIDRMVDGAQRLRQLVQDLLGYSRSSNDAMKIDEVPLAALIAEVSNDFEVVIGEIGAVIECESDAVLLGDRVMLHQLFQNLLSNALKYRSDAAPHIRIFADRLDESACWRLRVEDNGIGFSSRHAKRVFEIFKRLHPRDQYPGTGIGLALCQRVAERHGGRIWAESEPGQGTRIQIDWPFAPGDGLAAVQTKPAGPADGK
ncbi:PAS domain-containing protein [uncultured Maricaulis sp.]|uniref:PAS domain-containing protein n=1 Tax=uncultured Maricaulis sp. TaxID=174710 RepID=UPI0030DACED8|tara:strand:+ start:126058 stop:128100 length:2043 start_codon:yes stop_codon:yes gene_type:complete